MKIFVVFLLVILAVLILVGGALFVFYLFPRGHYDKIRSLPTVHNSEDQQKGDD